MGYSFETALLHEVYVGYVGYNEELDEFANYCIDCVESEMEQSERVEIHFDKITLYEVLCMNLPLASGIEITCNACYGVIYKRI